MKKIDFGQTMQILANIGVIAGLVFLGYELRQANAVAVNDSFSSTLEQFSESNWNLISDREVARIYLIGRDDPSALDEIERFQFETMMHQWFLTQEIAILPILQGIAAPDLVPAIRNAVRNELSHRGTLEWWQSERNVRPQWAKDYINSLMLDEEQP